MEKTMNKHVRGIIILVCAIIFGLLVGMAFDRAYGAAPERRTTTVPTTVYRDDCGDCKAKVATKRQGVRKFKRGLLGRARKNISYTPKQRRIFKAKIIRAWNRHNARMAARGMPVTERTGEDYWAQYKRQDNCVATWQPGGGTSTDYWSCQKGGYIPRGDSLKKSEIRGVICGGAAFIVYKGQSAPIGPWGWAAVGSAFMMCQWGHYLAD